MAKPNKPSGSSSLVLEQQKEKIKELETENLILRRKVADLEKKGASEEKENEESGDYSLPPGLYM